MLCRDSLRCYWAGGRATDRQAPEWELASGGMCLPTNSDARGILAHGYGPRSKGDLSCLGDRLLSVLAGLGIPIWRTTGSNVCCDGIAFPLATNRTMEAHPSEQFRTV